NNLILNNIINETTHILDEGGIWIRTNSNDNKLKNNILILANIEIGHSFRINLTENKLYYCWISLKGSRSSDSSHFIEITNEIDESPIYYIVNKSGGKLANYSGAGALLLVNCNNTEISDMIFTSYGGIFMRYCFNNIIMNNQFSIRYHSGIDCGVSSYNNIRSNSFNKCGISLNHCNKNNISKNHIFRGLDGIYLRLSSQNNVFENDISMTDYGMFIAKCEEENTISHNHISVADYGMFIWESYNATISYNTIYNTNISIYFWDSSYNHVKNNILFANKSCILEDGTCIGNFFEDNSCNETPILPTHSTDSISGYYSFILIFIITLIAILLYIKKNSNFPKKKP
ncbi:MAG: NosD domain-containing protein, partial [Candidatus Hodarchaeota archaeon]